MKTRTKKIVAAAMCASALCAIPMYGCTSAQNDGHFLNNTNAYTDEPGGEEYLEGIYYAQGEEGHEQDMAKALENYEAAAKKGNAKAARQAGEFYYFGTEGACEADYSKAIGFFEQSAEQDDGIAQYYLGLCYKFGLGTDIDEARANELLQKSYDNGCENALQYIDGADASASSDSQDDSENTTPEESSE